MLTANLLKWPDAENLIRSTISVNPARGVKEIGLQLLQPHTSFAREFTPVEKQVLEQGEVIYKELCFACHGPDGRGMPLQGGQPGMTMGPPLAGSKTATSYRDGIINVVLKGLTGPVRGHTYEAKMVPMESNDDAWIAAVTSYIRNSFGNNAPLVETNDVARVRAAIRNRTQPWTLEELQSALPQPLTNHSQWKVTASHGERTAPLAIDGDLKTRYSTGKSQVPGMWFQVELPEATTITALQLDCRISARDYPRGYRVELSNDGRDWNKLVAAGQGTGTLTEIIFPPTKAKFIRITQTGSVSGLFWSIHELHILKPAELASPQFRLRQESGTLQV